MSLLASASLKGKEKKAYEAKKIEALGGKAASNRHTPYNILMGMKKKGAVREKRQQELVRFSLSFLELYGPSSKSTHAMRTCPT